MPGRIRGLPAHFERKQVKAELTAARWTKDPAIWAKMLSLGASFLGLVAMLLTHGDEARSK